MFKRAKRILRNKKALTALQTAILTGVGIAVALIVGYWVWTVVVGSIRTERLNLTLPSATFSSGKWTITFNITNVGPSDATVVDIRVNGKTYGEWKSATDKATIDSSDFTGKYHIKAGENVECTVTLSEGSYKHGQTVEIAVVTASNQVYTASVSLP